jgi:hypothetical protein
MAIKIHLKNGIFWDVTMCGSCKNWFLQEPHGVTSQKMPFFMVTAVKTSNLTKSTSASTITRPREVSCGTVTSERT